MKAFLRGNKSQWSLRISRQVEEVSPNDRTSAVSNCVTGAEPGSSCPQNTRRVLWQARSPHTDAQKKHTHTLAHAAAWLCEWKRKKKKKTKATNCENRFSVIDIRFLQELFQTAAGYGGFSSTFGFVSTPNLVLIPFLFWGFETKNTFSLKPTYEKKHFCVLFWETGSQSDLMFFFFSSFGRQDFLWTPTEKPHFYICQNAEISDLTIFRKQELLP